MKLFVPILVFVVTLQIESFLCQRSASGDFETTSNTRLFNCCNRAEQTCRNPCSGRECTDKCTVRCGFLGSKVCSPVTCQAANPTQCTAGSGGSGGSTAGCDSGYTQVGTKCYMVQAGPLNYLDALTSCISMGSKLASLESEAEQNAAFALTGSTGAWLGLTDFLDEGVFSWVDGAVFDSATSYNNWRPNQPNNGNVNQHCVWIRPDGGWDDVTCKKTEAYVCQKTARS